MMGIPSGTQELAVNHHVTVEDDDGVGGGVAVGAGSRARSIADDVVLGARSLVVVEQLQLERLVVRGLLGRAERDLVQVRVDDGFGHDVHPARSRGRRGREIHLDPWVDDPTAAHDLVLSLGARVLKAAEDEDSPDAFQVYADPAGHPFCLCWVKRHDP